MLSTASVEDLSRQRILKLLSAGVHAAQVGPIANFIPCAGISGLRPQMPLRRIPLQAPRCTEVTLAGCFASTHRITTRSVIGTHTGVARLLCVYHSSSDPYLTISVIMVCSVM
jgi:hypothetical protein